MKEIKYIEPAIKIFIFDCESVLTDSAAPPMPVQGDYAAAAAFNYLAGNGTGMTNQQMTTIKNLFEFKY